MILVVTVIFAGCGGTAPPIDNNSEDISEEYYQESIEVFDLSEQKLNEIMEESPADVETCLMILGDYLIEQNNAESYEVLGDTIKFTFDSGIFSTITLFDLDATDPKLGGGNNIFTSYLEKSKKQDRKNFQAIPLEEQTTGKNITILKSNEKENYFIKSSDTKNVEYTGNRSVIIWDPFHSFFAQLGYDSASEYTRILNESGQYFNVTAYKDHEADIEALKTIKDYGIIIFDTHGSDGYNMVTGEVPDEFNKDNYKQELQPPNQEMYINQKIGVSAKNSKVEKHEARYGVTAYWFNSNHLSGDFPNSIIINNSCESNKYGFLCNTFLLDKAATYYGHSEDTHAGFGIEMVERVLQNLIDGKTTGEAYEEYSEIYWDWEVWHPVKITNTWEIEGKENVKIAVRNDEDDTNHPPVISSIIANPSSVDIDESTNITCTASDEDVGDTLTYTWAKTGGTITGSDSAVTWTAPSATGTYTITCTVSDGEGGEDSESINIVVTESEEPSGTYDLRDIGPAGGYIFYDKGYYSSGWRYLEAAPVSTEWTEKEWGSYGTKIGGTIWSIGTGQSNTTTIVTWLNSHSETGKAAQLCDDLVYGSYSDWFLPSLIELKRMHTNLKLFGVGGFADDLYWSSSELNASIAWSLHFRAEYQDFTSKNDTVRVRAARAF